MNNPGASGMQPSTSRGITAVGPSAASAGPSTTTTSGWNVTPSEDDESRVTTYPSFACDERALAEMRLAVGTMLESVGFTHAAHSALEILTDLGVRYMKKLATMARFTAEGDGRTLTTDADVLAGFRAMRIDIDEMNEYMRQVRPPASPRMVPCFPAPPPSAITYTPVAPDLTVPPMDHILKGAPPVSTLWLKPEQFDQLMEQQLTRPDAAEEPLPPSKVIDQLCGTDALPNFFAKSAAQLGLRKVERADAQNATVSDAASAIAATPRDRQRKDKRKGPDSKQRGSKQARTDRAPSMVFVPSSSGALATTGAIPAADLPSTSAVSNLHSVASSSHLSTALSSSSLTSLHHQQLATTSSAPSTSTFSGLRESSQRPMMTNVPPGGALPPDYNTYTEGAAIRGADVLSVIGATPSTARTTDIGDGSSRRSIEERKDGRQQEPSYKSPTPPPPAPPAPPMDATTLYGDPPVDAAPVRLVQLAILRSMFQKDRELDDEVKGAFAQIRGQPLPSSSSSTVPPSSSTPSISSRPPSKASGASASAARHRVKTPIAPETPVPTPYTPHVPSPAAAEPSTPLTITPMAPLRLKITIGPPPDEDTAGPSSSSTIPSFMSPGMLAQHASGMPLAADGSPWPGGTEGGEDGEEEGDDSEKKAKKKKKEKKHKKHKKHKKSKHRDGEDEEGGGGSKSGGSRPESRSTVADSPSAPEVSAAPSPGGFKLKIRLGPRPTIE